ncbi:MAG: hypothetical protein ACFB6R_13120 [Alphaproteobacteria bacterium]
MNTTDEMTADLHAAMTAPGRYLFRMVLFLIIVGIVAYLVRTPVIDAFLGNPVINTLILLVMILGVIYCITRVLALGPEVQWVNAFRRGDPELTMPRRTSLLSPMASMLRDQQGSVALSATSNRVILDSIGARLDESREITRYTANLLIFLGILGTFWGLLQSTGAIQGTLEAISVGGGSPEAAFEDLQQGLTGPLAGMDTAFSSSLFGISGSLILGFLGLQAAQAQNRFYNDFEEWLSTITHIGGTGLGEGPAGATATPDMMGMLDANMRHIDALRQTIAQAEERRAATEQWIVQTTQNLSAMDEVIRSQRDLIGGLAALSKDQAVQAEERHRQHMEMLQAIAVATRQSAEHGGGGALAPAAGGGGGVNLSGIGQALTQLAAATQQSDEKLGKTLMSLREIAARLLQHAERGTGDQTVQALKDLNGSILHLVSVTQGQGAPVVPVDGDGASAPAPVMPMDPSLLRELNARLDRLVARADEQHDAGVDKASLETLRSLDKTASRILQSAEALADHGQSGEGGGNGLGGNGNGRQDLQPYLQELVTHARGSHEREILEALRSINTIAHSLRELAEESRSDLLKELRSEMKILTKTIAALIIEGRRGGDGGGAASTRPDRG